MTLVGGGIRAKDGHDWRGAVNDVNRSGVGSGKTVWAGGDIAQHVKAGRVRVDRSERTHRQNPGTVVRAHGPGISERGMTFDIGGGRAIECYRGWIGRGDDNS